MQTLSSTSVLRNQNLHSSPSSGDLDACACSRSSVLEYQAALLSFFFMEDIKVESKHSTNYI